ncbi:MAG: ATP-dependent Clp protease ATP-binding subunit [Rhodocyclaceae bacterium]|nr:ATP-dependent Clp protease ATP-binding subunit [Rhodocyclaceae bacterium]
MTDDLTPRWLKDLERLLPIRSQFVVSGNIRDSLLLPLPGGAPVLVPLLRGLWEKLKAAGYRYLLVFDPADGLRVYPAEPAVADLAARIHDLKLQDGVMPMGLESLAALMKRLAASREARGALVVDFASRLARAADHLDANEHRFFVAAEKLSLAANPVVPKPEAATAGPSGAPPPAAAAAPAGPPLFNPVVWLVNRPQDLPSWFALDSERIASLTVGRPDFETRQAAARQLAPLFPGHAEAAETEREDFARRFANTTDGLTLVALADVAQLALRQNIGLKSVEDAVRCYKVGALDNPWRKDYLRDKIRGARAALEDRVKGQHQATVKTIDILMRSVMGLTGAQARSAGSRPRGVLFFAGPTGVGKTELAKTLTQLIFGDERAYIRFDMSEFAEEHAGARLLGAPPGYIGYDAGGELTGAVREKPFSVVLFDEIEKAHPRILDKFLQILEDGRLTDGRGDTAYFSEAIIIFTSNLGIFVADDQGRRVQNVRPGDPYDVVESRVRNAIADHFKYRLARPEILNRIGDNIVVFNFISADIAARIFAGMLGNVVGRVRDEHKVELVVPDEVRERLLGICTRDLSNGGRGIGNALESAFINPLARALFDLDLEGRGQVTVTDIVEEDKVFSVNVA